MHIGQTYPKKNLIACTQIDPPRLAILHTQHWPAPAHQHAEVRRSVDPFGRDISHNPDRAAKEFLAMSEETPTESRYEHKRLWLVCADELLHTMQIVFAAQSHAARHVTAMQLQELAADAAQHRC